MEDVCRLQDAELMARLAGLVARERALSARLLVHLGEVDARELFRESAFPSMFEYAIEVLHMSENEAYVRIRAARLGRQFPVLLAMLERNELHLTAIKLLGPHLTEENHAAVLERARGKSRSEIERIVAELAPKPDVPSVVRKLPNARPAARATPHNFSSEAPKPRATALSPGRYKVQFTASEALHGKLEQLKDLMRHQVPDGDLAVILERAADLMIEKQMTQRFARVKAPRESRPRTGESRYVPRAVLREVHARDGGQCTFVSSEGRRCSARGMLEVHHVDPYAKGGPPSSQNLRIVCRAHNGLYAEWDYGRAFMQEKRSGLELEQS